jgi:hypothetical protein
VWFVLHCVQVVFEGVETRLPHLAIGREPLVDAAQWLGAHAIQATLGVPADGDEASFAQDAQVFGHGWLAEAKFGDEVADGALGGAQQIQNPAAVGLGERFEDGHVALDGI